MEKMSFGSLIVCSLSLLNIFFCMRRDKNMYKENMINRLVFAYLKYLQIVKKCVDLRTNDGVFLHHNQKKRKCVSLLLGQGNAKLQMRYVTWTNIFLLFVIQPICMGYSFSSTNRLDKWVNRDWKMCRKNQGVRFCVFQWNSQFMGITMLLFFQLCVGRI